MWEGRNNTTTRCHRDSDTGKRNLYTWGDGYIAPLIYHGWNEACDRPHLCQRISKPGHFQYTLGSPLSLPLQVQFHVVDIGEVSLQLQETFLNAWVCALLRFSTLFLAARSRRVPFLLCAPNRVVLHKSINSRLLASVLSAVAGASRVRRQQTPVPSRGAQIQTRWRCGGAFRCPSPALRCPARCPAPVAFAFVSSLPPLHAPDQTQTPTLAPAMGRHHN